MRLANSLSSSLVDIRVAVYVRVSTPNQVHAQTMEGQLERLRQHVQQKGWHLHDDNIFRDDGYSGASLNRPALDRLRDKARMRELDLVAVTAPDRLARNYVHQMVLIEELERNGCAVEFLDRPMSQDPHDQLLLQIRGAVAEYERVLITERMRRGRSTKLQAGVLLPWTHAPYGYRVHPDKPRDPTGVELDPFKSAVAAEIFAMYLEDGATLWSLSKHLEARQIPSPFGRKRWGLATLRGILTNPTYAGKLYTGRTRYREAGIRRSATHLIGRPRTSGTPTDADEWNLIGTVPAIVSQEQFDLVQAKLPHNQRHAWRNNKVHSYLLRALVSCGTCSRACTSRTTHLNGKPKYPYYICSGKGPLYHIGAEARCPSMFIPAQQLDELVWQDLCEVLTSPGSISAALERAHGGHWLPQELQARRTNLQKARASLKQQLERLTDAYLGGVIPLAEYERRRRELEQKDNALAGQEEQIEQQTDRHKEISGLATGIAEFCQRVEGGLAHATFEQKRQLVELLIDRVIVTEGDVEIRYVIPTTPESEHIRFCHLRTDYICAPNLVPFSDWHISQ